MTTTKNQATENDSSTHDPSSTIDGSPASEPTESSQTTRIIDWTPLPKIHVYEWLSSQTKKAAEELNDRINAMLDRRHKVDDHASATRSEDVEKMDIVGTLTVNQHLEATALAFQDELALRREIAQFYALREPERRQEEERAVIAHREAGERVTAELVKIGYIDQPTPDRRIIGRIQPGWIAEHPEVYNALQRVHGIHDFMTFQQQVGQNDEAMDQIRKQLARFRDRAMGQLGPAT